MSSRVQIELLPLGTTLSIEAGTSLQDVLFSLGVEFPCGGRGRCKGCRIHLLAGSLPITTDDERLLTPPELAQGWRLACRARPVSDLKLELEQWETLILTDSTALDFTPREGLGVAVDLGTTTLVVQLIDLQSGNVLGVRTALNAQACQGADVMSRIERALAGGQGELQQLIRNQIGTLIGELLGPGQARDLGEVVIVGNTVMHHLFCGLSVEPLSHFPFEPEEDGLKMFSASELGWNFHRVAGAAGSVCADSTVHFLPCLGGFVGSDILAGVLAVPWAESERPTALIDLGTNGEIVVGNGDRLLCASTAAGPAFEGARISMGMRAATGAISEVAWRDGAFVCRVLGGGEARGICGSGLVDAVAAGLEAGCIHSTGRIAHGTSVLLRPPVILSQKDVRELQLAKGAIAAGLRILLRRWGAKEDDLSRIYLAGAFGNYISRLNAQRIGLLNYAPERVEPTGNTALRGAKLALFALPKSRGEYRDLRGRIQHLSLTEDAEFQDVFVEEMRFPS